MTFGQETGRRAISGVLLAALCAACTDRSQPPAEPAPAPPPAAPQLPTPPAPLDRTGMLGAVAEVSTPGGAVHLKLPPKEFIDLANKKYNEWKRAQPVTVDVEVEEEATVEQARPKAFDQAAGLARTEIRDYINHLEPYPFQELVAALLRAMGYHVPFVAPKGPDGGIDILAYRDPFGAVEPRIKVQVKHRETKATPAEIRQLSGLLNKSGDTGLFVSSGGFTPDAVEAIRNAAKHIEKIDLDSFIDLWEQYFDKMDEEDQARLPLRRIAFLAPQE